MKMKKAPSPIKWAVIAVLLMAAIILTGPSQLLGQSTDLKTNVLNPLLTLPIRPLPTIRPLPSIRPLPLTSGPDLIPTALFFDSDNVLNVTFKNEGDLEVPSGVGTLSIFIDGKPIGGYSLPMLTDQSFRTPGGSITIRTNFRMSGSNRRVAVVVDPNNDIRELNEYQNSLSRTMTPPAASGPDFVVSDLYLDSYNHLKIAVKNIGTAASTSLTVRLRVIVNETVAADLTPTLPSLAADGAATIITPLPAITISPNTVVRVLLNTNNFYDELDSTNNVREEMLPNGYSLTAYYNLLSMARIQNNINWESATGVQNYTGWSATQLNELTNTISALENGNPLPVQAPPAVDSYGRISATDAWKLYLETLAQSLWVEVHQTAPWSMLSLSDAQLALLLDGRKYISYYTPTNRYRFDSSAAGDCTAWNPKICYEFLTNLGLLRGTQLDTLYALTDWMRAHLSHMGGGTTNLSQFGYSGQPPADKILYPLDGKNHVTGGCWCTTGLYGAVLRSVNIPVEQAYTDFGALHSRPAFPSLDRSLSHGDDPYNSLLTPSGNVVPIDQIFYTYDQMDSLFLNPVLDSANGVTNTIGQQASYNKVKNTLQLAYNYMSDSLLFQYATYGPAYLNDSLRGARIGGGVVEYAKPFFTDAERAAMVTAVENKLMAIGNGDLAAGKLKVTERYNRFLQHK